MLSLRVISDTAAAPFPAPPWVLFDLAQQKTKTGKLLGNTRASSFRLIVRLIAASRCQDRSRLPVASQ